MLLQLPGGVLPADNGPSHQPGEEGDVQQEPAEPAADTGRVPVHVHYVGYPVEGEKGYAHGQGQARGGQGYAQQGTHHTG